MIRYRFDTEGLMTPIENVKQHPDNDNNGDVDEIVTSMLKNGVYRPIIANRGTGYIVSGNHTYLALLELGAQFVPVVWIDVNEATELRILVGDNQIASLARREAQRSRQLLERINAIEGGPIEATLVGTGFDERKWLDLIKEPTPLDLSNVSTPGAETLEHRITCPSCGHNWKRGQEA